MKEDDYIDKNEELMPTAEEERELRRAIARSHIAVPSVDDAWQQFSHRHIIDKKEVKVVPFYRKPIFMGSIAAAIVAVFVVAWALYSNGSDNYLIKAQNEMAQVTFVDANGEVQSVDTGKPIVMARKKHTSTRTVSMESVKTPRGITAEVILEDGTHVWLNNESELLFPESFAGAERKVTVRGEAYFDVAKDAKHPFIVEGEGFAVKVLGTEFNIRSRGVNDRNVALVEGSLKVSEGSSDVTISPGEMALCGNGSIKVSEVDTYPLTQWKCGFFYFNGESLDDILTELGRWYNVNVIVENPELLDVHLHFVASHSQELGEVVGSLNSLIDFDLKLEDGDIVVKKGE